MDEATTKVLELFSKGKTFDQIADELNSSGVTTPTKNRKWNISNVNYVIQKVKGLTKETFPDLSPHEMAAMLMSTKDRAWMNALSDILLISLSIRRKSSATTYASKKRKRPGNYLSSQLSDLT